MNAAFKPRRIEQAANARVSRRAALLLGASLGALLAASDAHAGGHTATAGPPPLSPAWFAARQGGRGMQTATGGGIPAGSLAAVQTSIDNMRRAAQAIGAAQALQSQAHAAALLTPSNLPNGIAAGGLQPAAGAAPNSANWLGANLPAQVVAAGRTKVTVRQTAPQAILNWTSFNVGQATDLAFDQSAGNQAAGAGARPANTWTVLNRIGASTSPSQILGSITAQGQVLVINPNGVLFTGTSQINVNSLIVSAGDIADSQFLNATSGGIYGAGTTASFTGLAGAITVQPGAVIATYAPASAADRGGFVLMLGSEVDNGGAISTPSGQTALAAGASISLAQGYVITPGQSIGNTSTTLGNVLGVTSGGGMARNTGLIATTTGDVTLTGKQVVQAGVATSTTSVTQRGTVHLIADGESGSAVTLFAGATTLITPDLAAATEVDSQRSGQFAPSIALNNLAAATLDPQRGGIPDRSDLSRIQISAPGGSVEFQAGSLTLATGGQIAVSTNATSTTPSGRVQVDTGALLDVAGALDVTLPASADALSVNVQGFQLRDSPANRETGKLASLAATVDISQLVPVSAGVGGYATAREYTPGGLLEVSAELGNAAYGIAQRLTPGGVVTLNASEIVGQTGAVVNIAGGSTRYLAGNVATTWLTDASGRLYNINTAPANVTYTGTYQGFSQTQPRWVITRTFTSPLIAPPEVFHPGYSVGRDGGSLVLSAPTVVFESTIDAGVVQGENQTAPRPATPAGTLFDPYALAPTVAPIGGGLLLGNYGNAALGTQSTAAPIVLAPPFTPGTQVQIAADTPALADTLTVTAPIPADRVTTAYLPSQVIDAAGLGALALSTQGTLGITAPVSLGYGGTVTLTSPAVTLASTITARGGGVAAGNLRLSVISAGSGPNAVGGPGAATATLGITLTAAAAIDTRGVWTNAYVDPNTVAGEAFTTGGAVALDTTQTLTLAAGSVIDASGGGVLLPNRTQTAGQGGNITLIAFDQSAGAVPIGTATIAGTLRSAGSLGGALSISVPSVTIASGGSSGGTTGGTGGATASDGSLVLAPSFFQAGFSAYAINGYGTATTSGVSVASGTVVQVAEPVYQANPNAQTVPTGGDPASAFDLTLLPLYTQDAATARLTQRPAASLSLTSLPIPADSSVAGDLFYATTGSITIGQGASIAADPGGRIRLIGNNQITILGTLAAPGGEIDVLNARSQAIVASTLTYLPGLSIWLGPDSRLDVAGQAASALDMVGRPYGVVPAGGTVELGTAPTAGALLAPVTDAFVIARPGSVIDVSGASAGIDPNAGQASAVGPRAAPAPVPIASDAGSIAVSSGSGIHLDGALRAFAGGPNASGGSLSITLVTPNYGAGAIASAIPLALPTALAVPRSIVVEPSAKALPTGLLPGETADLIAGQAPVAVSAVQAGGFAQLALAASDDIVFDGNVTLSASRGISLTAGVLGETRAAGSVSLSAPYVQLNGLPAIVGGATTPVTNTFGSLISSVLGNSQNWAAYAKPVTSQLLVSADLVDITGELFAGISQTLAYNDPAGSHTLPPYQVPGFQGISIVSAGDVRFAQANPAGSAGASTITLLTTPGTLSITAGQVYPLLGDQAYVLAGFAPATAASAITGPGPNYVFVAGEGIGIMGAAATPAPPLTAGGNLTLAAGTITQGGVVRAPDGVLELGVPTNLQLPLNVASSFSQTALATTRVELLPGSVTSVSGFGTTVPYGGTSDGLSYTASGAFVDQAGTPIPLNPALLITSTSVAIDAGATVDLRGGGTLTGAGFVSGRGGSTDVLGSSLLSLAGGAPSVYAVLPGLSAAYAAPASAAVAGDAVTPPVGQQITLATSAAGLPAGTYTLLPAIDALLPGAYRVEIGATSASPLPAAVVLGNGSMQVEATLGIANTAIRESLPNLVTVTPGAVVRSYASYTETTYSQFVNAQAALLGQVRTSLPEDSKRLILGFAGTPDGKTASLAVQGSVLSQAASGGYGLEVDVSGPGILQITPDAELSTASTTSLRAADLNALQAATLSIGGYSYPAVSGSADRGFAPGIPNAAPSLTPLGLQPGGIVVKSGANLAAAEVFLVTNAGSIAIEQGATIDTVGRGSPSLSGIAGLNYSNGSPSLGANSGGNAVVSVSNGLTLFGVPIPQSAVLGLPSPPISIGGCVAGNTCAGAAGLFSEGSLTFSTTGPVSIADTVRYGGRYLDFSVSSINIGGAAALASATVPPGLTLSQASLATLLAGDPTVGTPALQSLILTASQSVNFYGSVSLNTIDPATGQSSLAQLVLNTPSIYGFGAVSDAVTLTTGALVWNGIVSSTLTANGTVLPISAPAAGAIAHGPGTGAGTLTVDAQTIVLGYAANATPNNQVSLDRNLLGFSAVTLNASASIEGNNLGTLSVYQSQTYQPGHGFTGVGGALTLNTPLLTGAAASTLAITTGGALSVVSPGGAAAVAQAGAGATLTLNAGTTLDIASAIVLPSGRLTLNAPGDITLEAASRLDVAGQSVKLIDQTVYGFGGDVLIASGAGNITQRAGGAIDVSAIGNSAGTVSLTATQAGAGVVTMDGTISGASTQVAGGAAHASGGVTLAAQSLAVDGAADGFAAFNLALDAGGVSGARSFDLKTGDLTIGGTIRASSVTVSIDAGSLTVAGVLDASGATPGTIRLSGQTGLAIDTGASLLAQSGVLQTDSTGAPIDSVNRAVVELTSAAGPITLAAGSTINVGDADGVARGTVTLNAPRTATGIAVAAAGPVNILGAAAIVANGFRTYVPTDPAGSVFMSSLSLPVAGGIDLVAADADSQAFIAGAQLGPLAGLTAYGAAFHLRPGVEIDSSAKSSGNLTVRGDIDLSGFRYGPDAKGAGTGEPGALVLRAADNLDVFGSITDGFAVPSDMVSSTTTTFATVVTVRSNRPSGPIVYQSSSGAVPPPVTSSILNPDTKGFVLQLGAPTIGDTILPTAIVLAGGGGATATSFQANPGALNFAITLGSAQAGSKIGPTLQTNAPLPADLVIAQAYTIPAGTVVRAPILDAGGATLFPAGALVGVNTVVPAGARLSAGNVLPSTGADPLVIAAGQIWPAGASLGAFTGPAIYLGADTTVPAGSLLPVGTTPMAATSPLDVVSTISVGIGASATAVSVLDLRAPTATDGRQGSIYAATPLLPAGTQSWSLRLVGGADIAASDQRAVLTASALAASGAQGDVTLSDPHVQTADIPQSYVPAIGAPTLPAEFSVVRTGTGDLDLLAGGSIVEGSSFGIYTAGAQSAGVATMDNQPRATTPAPAGTALAPTVLGYTNSATNTPQTTCRASGPGACVPGLTLRPGRYYVATTSQVQTTSPYEPLVTGGNYQAEYPTGGGNVLVSAQANVAGYELPNSASTPVATSNSNIGNWLWRQGGASLPTAWWISFGTYTPVALDATGGVTLTGFAGIGALGGGNVSARAGGNSGATPVTSVTGIEIPALDVAVASTGRVANGAVTLTGGGALQIQAGGNLDQGTLADLRGTLDVRAGALGSIAPITYVNAAPSQSALTNPPGALVTLQGPVVVPGDATVTLSTRGDLAFGGVGDATRLSQAGVDISAIPGFSLWGPTTAIDLFSAGGNVAPVGPANAPSNLTNTPASDNLRQVYPPILSVTAASGSIYGASFELAPSPQGQLELLAAGSVDPLSGSYTVDISGAATSGLSSPLRPSYAGAPGMVAQSYTYSDPIFAFEDDAATGTLHAGDPSPALIYAAGGDIVGLGFGEVVSLGTSKTELIAAKAARIVAGRDIVDLGRPNFATVPAPNFVTYTATTGSVIVDNNASDVSVLQAGRDILYADLQISGPGQLYVQAGRNVYQGNQGILQSIQPLTSRSGGAGITVIAGTSTQGPDWSGFAGAYLNPANPADAPYLATLDGELAASYGGSGSPAGDLALLDGLSPQAQGTLLEPIYFDILRASGRQFNDPSSIHYKSYVTGRQAIAALFPATGAAGQPLDYAGTITFFPLSAQAQAALLPGEFGPFIRTDFGGDVNLLAPGGQVLVGSASIASPGGEGVLTQGRGNIGIYSQGSVLLGQSRIFTTFGGGITIWSASGDINAGRGAGGTQAFSPLSIVYDAYGNVSLSPNTTTTGAGIATLAPIAGIAPGDVDLIAPLGTIDAGEAGIRVSGNVNLAALTIANAANIQVSGKTTGIPTVAVPNVAATLASVAATAGTDQAAQDERRRQREQQEPAASLITVEVTEFGP